MNNEKKIEDTNKIFRAEALEHLSSPEQLNQMMQILTPKAWLFLANTVFVVFVFLLWGIFASIPLKVHGNGILIKRGGIHNVIANRKGRIHKIHVEVGDVVEKGQVVASLIVQVAADEFISGSRRRSIPGQIFTGNTSDLGIFQQIIYDVISPFTGKVVEIKILPGSVVGKDSVIMHLETLDRNLEAILYVSPREGKKISIGSIVQIVPTTVRKEQFGFIYGKVQSISEFPATKESMVSLLKNNRMADMFSSDGPPIEVIARLIADPRTISGYKWSSQTGPAQKINSGTICEVDVVYETQRPIVLLFLWLRKSFVKQRSDK